MRAKLAFLALGAVFLATSGAHADDYFGGEENGRVVYRIDGSRTKRQRVIIGALAGGAVAFGGIGLLFHLDSRSASNEVSAVGDHTGRTYTQALDDERSRAVRSRKLAIAGYAVGGALVIGTAIALVLTEPDAELIRVDDQPQPSPVSVAPLPGGAVVGGTWSF